jgi:hypothetical protein
MTSIPAQSGAELVVSNGGAVDNVEQELTLQAEYTVKNAGNMAGSFQAFLATEADESAVVIVASDTGLDLLDDLEFTDSDTLELELSLETDDMEHSNADDAAHLWQHALISEAQVPVVLREYQLSNGGMDGDVQAATGEIAEAPYEVDGAPALREFAGETLPVQSAITQYGLSDRSPEPAYLAVENSTVRGGQSVGEVKSTVVATPLGEAQKGIAYGAGLALESPAFETSLPAPENRQVSDVANLGPVFGVSDVEIADTVVAEVALSRGLEPARADTLKAFVDGTVPVTRSVEAQVMKPTRDVSSTVVISEALDVKSAAEVEGEGELSSGGDISSFEDTFFQNPEPSKPEALRAYTELYMPAQRDLGTADMRVQVAEGAVVGPSLEEVGSAAALPASVSPSSASPNNLQMLTADFSNRFASQVFEVARQLPDRPVEITLSPEELGKVKLTFQVSESGAMTVIVAAERPETLELMRRNADTLLEEFRSLGYEDSQFEFQQEQSGNGEGESGPGQNSPGVDGEDLGQPTQSANKLEKLPQEQPPLQVSFGSATRMDLRI